MHESAKPQKDFPTEAEARPQQRERAQLAFALGGIILPLLALNTVEGFAIAAAPRAIANLNGFARYSWPSTSFLLTSTITMPVFAKLSDLYGRKWFYLFGAVMSLAYAVFCGSAGALPILPDGMTQVVAGSALLGLGHAAIIVLSFTLVADLFPPRERGRYQGLIAAVSILPFTIGPSLGGWITDHLSWRWAYYVNLPLCAIAAAAIFSTVPGFPPRETRPTIDWAGNFLLCGWLSPLLLALTWVGKSGWSSPAILALLIASAVLLFVFALVELRAPEPLLSVSLLGDRRIGLVCFSIFITGGANYGVAVYLPLFLQGVAGASATATGIIFALYVLATMVGSVIGGRLLSRIEWHSPLAITGAVLTTIGLFLLSRMSGSTTQLEVLRNAIVCGIGFGALTPTYEVLVQNEAPAGTMGMATGITQFARAVGGAIALALFGTMLLKLYHQRMDHLIPPGASVELKMASDDPLRFVLEKPAAAAAVSGMADAETVLKSFVQSARVSLMSALQSIFLASGAALAVSSVANMLIGKPASPDD